MIIFREKVRGNRSGGRCMSSKTQKPFLTSIFSVNLQSLDPKNINFPPAKLLVDQNHDGCESVAILWTRFRSCDFIFGSQTDEKLWAHMFQVIHFYFEQIKLNIRHQNNYLGL